MVSVPAGSFGRSHCIFLSYCKAFRVDPRQEAEPDITAGGSTIRYRSTSGANASVPDFSALFGCCGELARKSIYARRKAFRTTTLSLGLSFLAFISFLNLETISGIFTEDTYFNQYRDKWDFLLSIDASEVPDSGLTDEITKIEGVKSCLTYRRLKAQAALPEELFSSQLKETGIGNLNDQIKKVTTANI